jgi:pyruvate kinase
MSVMRLNFSHGDHEEKELLIKQLRAVVAQSQQRLAANPLLRVVDFDDGSLEDLCAVAADTKGPEIRTGMMANNQEVQLTAGSRVIVTNDPAQRNNCARDLIFIDYGALLQDVKRGQRICIDDGKLTLVVEDYSDLGLVCRVQNTARLNHRKGVNLPGLSLNLPAVTEQDYKDLAFCAAQGVDMVFASFVRRAAHVHEIRAALGPAGKNIMVISKIECCQGLTNFDEILAARLVLADDAVALFHLLFFFASDGIMVARGDLGIESPPHKVGGERPLLFSPLKGEAR